MDHRDKTEVPDPLAVEDLIGYKLNNRRKLANLIAQYRNIFSNISERTASLLQGDTYLLLTEFEVPTVGYGPSFSPSIYGSST